MRTASQLDAPTRREPGAPADAVLLRRIARGDAPAFTTLVERYQRRFYTVARRMLGHDGDAEDAVQLAFLRVLLKAKTYRDDWQGSTWLYRVLTNVCIDACRKRRHESGTPEATEPSHHERGAERLDLEAGLRRLPTEARVILLLCYAEDVSYGDVARIRGISINTVKTQLRRAKQLMRRYLKGDDT
jgi:RNA polymerase sigma-70 factor (ECF subfamily)